MSKLTLEAIEVLDAIDRKGSFAAAAAALYRVPSAVTYSVQKLEEDLGVSLFRKEGRRHVLTPSGRVLLEQGRELLLAAERLVETTRQVDSGWESCFNIAVDSVIGFDDIYSALDAFYSVKPDIEINLYEEVLGGAWEALLVGRVDLVVGAADPPTPLKGMKLVEYGNLMWGFYVPAGHPLLEIKRPLTEEDISQYRAVVVRDSSQQLPPLTRRVYQQQAHLKVNNLQQKVDAQLRGLGVGYLPKKKVEVCVDSGALVELEVAGESLDSPTYMAWSACGKGRALKWFVEYFLSSKETMPLFPG